MEEFQSTKSTVMKKILVAHLGILHNDSEIIRLAFAANNINCDFYNMLTDDIDDFDLEEYFLVDFRNCRGYQEVPDFIDRLQVLHEKLNHIQMIPSFKMINWNIHKSYLGQLRDLGIKVVPSQSYYWNFDFDFVKHIEERGNRGVVLKPIVGSRAYQTMRIRKLNGSKKFEVFIPHRETDELPATNEKIVLTAFELKTFLESYKTFTANGILIQDYIPCDEYCAVFIGNELSHFVKKEGPEKDNIDSFYIHHKNFGGKNIVTELPDNELIHFANTVFTRQPEWIKNEKEVVYERIDIISDIESNEKYLLEIEAFVPDIFLQETNNVGKYIHAIQNSFYSRN